MACRRSGHGDGYGRGKQTGGPCSVVAVTGHGAHRNSSVIPRWLGGRGVCQAVCLAPTSYSAVVTVPCAWGRQKRWQQKSCARQLSASLLGGRRRATHGGRGRFRSLTLLGATVDSDYFWVGPVMREGERRRLPSRAKPSGQTGKRGTPFAVAVVARSVRPICSMLTESTGGMPCPWLGQLPQNGRRKRSIGGPSGAGMTATVWPIHQTVPYRTVRQGA